MSNRKIFIGCSSSAIESGILDEVKKMIENSFSDFEITPWNYDKGQKSHDIPGVHLAVQTEEYDYAILIGYPDDKISINGSEVHFVTRDNVIFEYGLFLSKLGKDNVFFFKPILPENTFPFKMLSNIGEEVSQELYNLNIVDGRFVFEKFQNSELFLSRIRNCEISKNSNAIKKLSDLINTTKNLLGDSNENKTHSFRIFKDNIEQIFLKKEKETEIPLKELLCDSLDVIGNITDFCKPENLSKIQSIDNDKGLREVWVFADEPLEFQAIGGPNHYVNRLRTTIENNLKKGVKYTYFVSNRFKEHNVTDNFCQDKEALKNITFIYIEALHFKTFFTLHFMNGSNIPSEIYMSALLKDRHDLLIKIDEQLHIKRIYRRLLKIKGERSTNGFEQINYVFDD